MTWQYRPDGWPLCPSCGEDELWSPELASNSTTFALSKKKRLDIALTNRLVCYLCGWAGMGPSDLERIRNDPTNA